MLSLMRHLVVIIIVTCIAGSSIAKVKNRSLKELVQDSDLILIGKMTKITETLSDDDLWAEGLSTIRVERVIKGALTGHEVNVIYDPCTPDVSARYYLCERCVFFLTRAERGVVTRMLFKDVNGKYFATGGYLGKVPIREFDEMAVDIHLVGEAEEQTLDKFVEKIDRLLK